MTDSRRLRRSSSSRTAWARLRRIASTVPSGASRGSIGADGLSTATRPIRCASSRPKSARASQWKRRT